MFKEKQPQEAVSDVLYANRPGYYNTDLGNSLVDFQREHLGTIDGRTTFIIVGDGRNNYNDPRLDIFSQLARRSHRTIWLNPEPPMLWATGDSDMLKYAPSCSTILQVSTLAELTAAVRTAHQFVTFAVATPFQHAAAVALAAGDEYYAGLHEGYLARRDRLCSGLEEAGFDVRRPEGTYFAVADVRPLGHEDGASFCRALVEEVGVAGIPLGAFAAEGRLRHLVRFAFCKDDATLEEGLRRLRRLKG